MLPPPLAPESFCSRLMAFRVERRRRALECSRYCCTEAIIRDMLYSVDRSGLYQTGGTLDLWQQDPLPGRPFWRLPDWFEADDLRAHVAELFPDGLSLHGWQ